MDFFSSHIHQFVFVFFYIILSIYKKRECLEAKIFLVCSTCSVSPASFLFFIFFECVKLQQFCYIVFGLFNSQCFTKLFSLGLGIMFWFSQVFEIILMLLKYLLYLFKAFGQLGEIDFFSSHVHQFVFVLFYIILSIYKKSECLEAIIFLICSICTISPAFFFLFFFFFLNL